MIRSIALLLSCSLFVAWCATSDAADKVPAKAAAPAQWRQWRGERRDGASSEAGLLDKWQANGPTLVWKAIGLGRGFSSVSVADEPHASNISAAKELLRIFVQTRG